MIAFYEFSKAIHDHFTAEADTNTIELRDFNEIDINKQTIFPLCHADIDSPNFPNDALLSFTVDIAVLDIVDQKKGNIKDIPVIDRWKGLDNRQDILNTQLAVLEKFAKSLRLGTLSDLDYTVTDIADAIKVRGEYENVLWGWTQTYTIEIPNTVKNC